VEDSATVLKAWLMIRQGVISTLQLGESVSLVSHTWALCTCRTFFGIHLLGCILSYNCSYKSLLDRRWEPVWKLAGRGQ